MRKRIDFPAIARHLVAQGATTRGVGQAIGLSQASVSRLAAGRWQSVGADAAIRLIECAGGSVQVPDKFLVDVPAPAADTPPPAA